MASGAFGDTLTRLRILMVHDCHFLPAEARVPHLVVARVAGYDNALYGLPDKDVWPLLFEHPSGDVLVATTKLSQFVTGRYAPNDAWERVWQMILHWVQPESQLPRLRWTPTVRPTLRRDDKLPRDHERRALKRGAERYQRSGLLVHPSWQQVYDRPANQGPATQDWPTGHRTGTGSRSCGG